MSAAQQRLGEHLGAEAAAVPSGSRGAAFAALGAAAAAVEKARRAQEDVEQAALAEEARLRCFLCAMRPFLGASI